MANPASLRIKEQRPSSVDKTGFTTWVVPEDALIDLGRGAFAINWGVVLAAVATYKVSNQMGDGVNTVFPFNPPIGTLILPVVAGMVNNPSDFTVDAHGNLVLGALVPVPSSVETVGAYYIPA